MFKRKLATALVFLMLVGQFNMGRALADIEPSTVVTSVEEPTNIIPEPVPVIEPVVEETKAPITSEPDAIGTIEPEPESVTESPAAQAVTPEVSAAAVGMEYSAVVDDQEIDLEDPLVSEKYFVVQYADGTFETRKVEQPQTQGVMAMSLDSVEIESAMQVFEQKSDVEMVEPLIIRHALDSVATDFPNDPEWDSQWGIFAIRANDLYGWNYTSNLNTVTVAVLDSGMDMDHPDLAGNLASVSLDDNTIVHGKDFVDNDYIPEDGFWHGTHVAGTVAAIVNNGIGVAGVAGGVKILPVRVLNNLGNGTTTDVIAGINWAVDHGADIINMSFGSSTLSDLEQQAIDAAYAKGVVFVGATGNDSNNWGSGAADLYSSGSDVDTQPVFYPAACNHVIGVGAVGVYGGETLVSDFSNADITHSGKVDVVAPGEAIQSTYLNGEYKTRSGTSMASPHVAGLAALIMAENPTLSPAGVETAIKDSAHMVTTGTSYGSNPDYYGAGLIDAYAAIMALGTNTTLLNNLEISAGSIGFSPATASYALTVDPQTSTIGIRPTANNVYQAVTVNGTLYSGTAFQTVALNEGSNTITVSVKAKDGVTVGTYTLEVTRPYYTEMSGGAQTVSLSGKTAADVVVLDIPEAVINPVVTTVPVLSGSVLTATLPALTATRTEGGATVAQISIPGGALVSAPASSAWNGSISLPVIKETATVSPDSGSVNKVIEMGFPGNTLTFSQAVRILIPDMAGKRVGYVSGGIFHEITTGVASDSQASGNALPDGGDGKINVGDDLVVWTKHFTEFVVYTPPSSGGGGGGGGGGSSSGAEVDVELSAACVMAVDTITVTFEPDTYSSVFQAKMHSVKYGSSPFKANQRLLDKVYLLTKNIPQEIDKPMSILFTTKAKDVNSGQERLAIFYLDPQTNQWLELPGVKVDLTKGTVEGTTKIFTEYAVLAVQKDGPVPVVTPVVPSVPAAPAVQPTGFTDLTGHWALEKVNALVAKKAIAGYPDGAFRPDAPITRGEFIAVLVKAQGMLGTKDLPFSDLEGHWAQDVIRVGYANGIATGFADGLFHPDEPITREQMAVMVDRTLRYIADSSQPTVTDQGDISPWAAGAIQRMMTFKIMGGYPDGTFKPQALATRAEAVTVILKTITN